MRYYITEHNKFIYRHTKKFHRLFLLLVLLCFEAVKLSESFLSKFFLDNL